MFDIHMIKTLSAKKFLSDEQWRNLTLLEYMLNSNPFSVGHDSEIAFALDKFIYNHGGTDGLYIGQLFVETCIDCCLPWVAAKAMCLAYSNAFHNMEISSYGIDTGMIWSHIRELYELFRSKELHAQYGYVLSYSAKNWCTTLNSKITEHKHSAAAFVKADLPYEASLELEQQARLHERENDFSDAAVAYIKATRLALRTNRHDRYEWARTALRTARANGNQGNDLNIASKALLLEKYVERHILLRYVATAPWMKRITAACKLIASLVSWCICGHFEKPTRVLITALIVTTACAILYLPELNIVELYGFDSAAYIGESMVTAFYFSVVTFITLGSGNIHPTNEAGMLITATEATFGLLLTGLFLFCLGRKSGSR